jgi:putative tryptophan/tyrosine transport system substrate-binding protein
MGVALAAPLAASAQQRGRKYRVGLALPPGEDLNRRMRGAVADRLASHGFVEGKNLEIRASVMSTTGGYYTRETVRAVLSQKPDVVLVFSTQFAHAFQQETATVPVVFTQVSDALAAGLVKNLARPGGNMTGVSTRHAELAVKRLQLLREILPKAKRVALFGFFWQPDLHAAAPSLRKAAADLGFELVDVDHMSGSWEVPLARAADSGASAVISWHPLVGSGFSLTADALAAFTTKRRMALIASDAEDVALGGLASYGTDPVYIARQGADQLARVLKGEAPGNIPVDQVSRFELVVNMKTARAIRVSVPQSVLLRADRVIE